MQEAKQEKQVLARAARKMWNLRLHAAFDGWRHRVSHLVHARRTASQMCARLCGQSASRAFSAWRAATHATRGNRAAAARVLVRACKSNLCQVLHSSFYADIHMCICADCASTLRWPTGHPILSSQ